MKKFTSLALASVILLSSNAAFAADGDVAIPAPLAPVDASKLKTKFVDVSTTDSQIVIAKKGSDKDLYQLLNGNGSKVYEGTDAEIVKSDLENDTYYTYYLVKKSLNPSIADDLVAITAKTKPAMGDDKGITTVVQTGKEISLNWVAAPDATSGYEVYRDGVLIGKSKDNSFTDTAIEAGHEYGYKVKFITKKQAKDEQGKDIVVDFNQSYEIGVNSTVQRPTPIYMFDPAQAETTHLRFKTFIGYSEVDDPNDLNPFDCAYKFDGDGRSFSYTSSAYRTYQAVNINFPNRTYSYSENVGQTERYCWSGSTKTNITTGYASMADMYVSGFSWTTSSVSFNMYNSSGNPLASVSPTIDAILNFKVNKGTGQVTGSTTLTIEHDGFPWYEVYRADGTLSYRALYQHDAAAQGQTPLSLPAPMEFKNTVTK